LGGFKIFGGPLRKPNFGLKLKVAKGPFRGGKTGEIASQIFPGAKILFTGGAL